jgi:hypothetical protein
MLTTVQEKQTDVIALLYSKQYLFAVSRFSAELVNANAALGASNKEKVSESNKLCLVDVNVTYKLLDVNVTYKLLDLPIKIGPVRL